MHGRPEKCISLTTVVGHASGRQLVGGGFRYVRHVPVRRGHVPVLRNKAPTFKFYSCSFIAVNLRLQLIIKINNITGITVQTMAAQVNSPVANAWAPFEVH